MSPLRPDRACAVLCPDQLQVVRSGTRWPRRSAIRFAESFAVEGDAPAWQPGVAALERFLAEHAGSAAALDVVVSNHFVRYVLLPWNAQVASDEEMRNCAAAMFEDIHGEPAAAWEVTVSAERTGAPRLAAAIDSALLAAVRAAVRSSRWGLASIQPYLMAAYNRVARPHTGSDFVFMLLEAGRACIVAAQEGQWCHVSTAAAPAPEQALALLLAREVQLADLHGPSLPPVYVHAAHRPGLVLPEVHGAAPRILERPVTDRGAGCELAASLA